MSIEDNIKDLTAAVGELNEGLGTLTTTVSELCAYMAKLVDSTADAVDADAPSRSEAPVKRTRKAKPATSTPAANDGASEIAAPAPVTAKDAAALRADLRGAAMRLAAHLGRDPAIARITEHLESRGIHVAGISALADEQVPETIAFLEGAIAAALKEAA